MMEIFGSSELRNKKSPAIRRGFLFTTNVAQPKLFDSDGALVQLEGLLNLLPGEALNPACLIAGEAAGQAPDEPIHGFVVPLPFGAISAPLALGHDDGRGDTLQRLLLCEPAAGSAAPLVAWHPFSEATEAPLLGPIQDEIAITADGSAAEFNAAHIHMTATILKVQSIFAHYGPHLSIYLMAQVLEGLIRDSLLTLADGGSQGRLYIFPDPGPDFLFHERSLLVRGKTTCHTFRLKGIFSFSAWA